MNSIRYFSIIGISLILVSCSSQKSDNQRQNIPFDNQYTTYGSVLDNAVIGEKVDYQKLKDNRAQLDSFIIQLSSISAVELNVMDSSSIMAFWINAYNGITLRSIIDAYPVNSIKDIEGVWNDNKWPVAGKNITLDEIEHSLLRPIFKDPRVHFAVNCASIGCPPLLPRPFTGKNLETQLESVTTAFINNKTRNEIDFQKHIIRTSQIFSWFKKDFELNRTESSNAAQILDFIAAYLDSSQIDSFKNINDWQLEYVPYDWSLNDYKK